jgi:TPR repeat protein
MKKAAKKVKENSNAEQIIKQREACLNDPDTHAVTVETITRLLTQLIEKDANTADQKLRCIICLAWTCIAKQDFSGALEYLQSYDKEYPNNPEILERQLQCTISLKQFKDANAIFRQIIKLKKPKATLARCYSYFFPHMQGVRNFKDANSPFKSAEKLAEILEFILTHGSPDNKELAQVYYDKFYLDYYLFHNKFEEAYASKSEDWEVQFSGMYACAQALVFMGKNLNLALIFLQKYTAMYVEKAKVTAMPQCHIDQYASALHSFAKIYDGDKDSEYADSVKEIEYLMQAAELGYARSHHDLGYIYENGGDDTFDINKAALHYAKAAELGHELSNLNLGIVLENRNNPGDSEQALNCLTLVTNNSDQNFQARAYANIGVHYTKKAIAATEPDIKQAHGKNAYDNLLISYQLGYKRCAYNLGYLYFAGISVEENLAKALEYFLIAEEDGLELDTNLIKGIYGKLIVDEHDVQIKNRYIVQFRNRFGEDIIPNVEYYSDLCHQAAEYKNKKIILAADDKTTTYLERLEELLSYKLENLNTMNVCTLIHKIGNLTDRTLPRRDIHSRNLTRILPILDNALQRLKDSRFAINHYSLVIEGVSKLYLTADIPVYKLLIESLFRHAIDKIDELEPHAISNMLLAATRLDPDIDIRFCLNALMKKTLVKIPTDDKLLANSIFAAVLLSLSSSYALSIKMYVPLVIAANAALANNKLSNAYKMQICQVLDYLYHNKIFRSHINKELLEQKIKELNTAQSLVTSGLQSEIIGYLKLFLNSIDEEKFFGIYSVDGFITLEKTSFILQVDGPSHFLHGNNTIKPHGRTLFRDAYLAHHFPVWSVPYQQWNECNDIRKYFEESFAGLGLTLPAMREPSNRPKQSIHGFFNKHKKQVWKQVAVTKPAQTSRPQLAG